MNRRLGKSIAVMLSLLAALWSFSAIANSKAASYDVSTAALQAGVDAPDGPAATNYATGFEAVDGFAPGYCGGQAGWTAFIASSSEGHIDNANPADGSQHLRISEDTSIDAGTLTGCFSPDLGVQPLTPSLMEIDVAISDDLGADYDVAPQAPSQGFITARVKFSWLGDILVVDDTGGGLAFVDTGVDWDVGPYRTLRIEVDPGDDTIFYYYNGALIWSSNAGVFAGTTIEQVVILSDNFHAGEDGDFDNLDIQNEIIEPPPEHARFLVSKAYNDGNTTEVEVTLSCNTGLPLEQTIGVAPGDPINFVIGDFEQGTLDCEVSEVVPVGYTASYASPDNVGDPAESCEFVDLTGGQYLCTITNSLNLVEVEVTKDWIDENPQFEAVNIADANWSCSNVAFGSSSGYLNFYGDPDTESFYVYPDWDTGTTCSVTEVNVPDGGVEVDDSDCDIIVVTPGNDGSCTIYNTRLYEGIPTLSHYGLGILALLMLGMGFVAFRRFA